MIILFLICFLFGFSGSSLIYHNDLQQKPIVNKCDVPSKEAFAFQNYDFYPSADLWSTANLSNYINWVYNADGVNLYDDVGNNYERVFQVGGDAFFNHGLNISSTNIEDGSTRYFTIQEIKLLTYNKNVYSNMKWSKTFQLIFTSTTNGDQQIRIGFFYVYNASLSQTNTYYCDYVYYTPDNATTRVPIAGDLILITKGLTIQQWSRDFFGFYLSDNAGYNSGFQAGYNTGYSSGYSAGYQTGYDEGLNGNIYNPEMLTIFTGILNVALLPVNVFLTIFNFEVFGINIAGFISSLLTVSIVIIIIRFIFGGKNND